jgi:ribosome-interacting GTPase 1
MAANLTPQYLEAEADYKKAQTAEERLACLKKMYSLLPKHKASEKLQADLKTKISEAKDEVERDKKHPKKTGVSYKIPKQGAGQYVILGAPNVGKSRLLTRLTRAAPEVAPYPFTTHEPHAGMMDWEDVRVQLIDTPPITADYLEGYLPGMIQSADAALLLVDLGDDDGPFAAETVIERLAKTKTNLVGDPNEGAGEAEKGRGGEQTGQLTPSPLSPVSPLQAQPVGFETKSLVIGNKVDLPGAADRLEIVRELFGSRFPIHVISAEHGAGLEDLRSAIYRFLNVIRVYTKQPGKPADLTSPFTCPIGSTLVEMAALVHRDFTQGLKSARIWGTGVYDGQSIKRDHVLHDKDIVELHL